MQERCGRHQRGGLAYSATAPSAAGCERRDQDTQTFPSSHSGSFARPSIDSGRGMSLSATQWDLQLPDKMRKVADLSQRGAKGGMGIEDALRRATFLQMGL